MNKIYKLIWSQTANAFVAVSELATARDKSSSTTNNAALGAWVAVSEITKSKGKKSNKAIKSGVLVSSLVLFAGNAIAAPYDAGGGTATGLDTIAIGQNANASGISTMALGADSVAQGIDSAAIGTKAEALGNESIALGARAKALEKNSTALGSQSTAEKEMDLAVGYNAIASGGQSTAVGFISKSTGFASNAIGGYSEAAGDFSTAVGSGARAEKTSDLAAGQGAFASGGQSTAVGLDSKSTGYSSNAIGTTSVAAGYSSTAVGSGARAENAFDLAVGHTALASGGQSTAVGLNSKSTGLASNAIGGESLAKGDFSTAVGYGARAEKTSDLAAGQGAFASGGQSTAVGLDSKSTGYSSNAIGTTSVAAGYSSTAVGSGARAENAFDLAVGHTAIASGGQSTAVGLNSKSTGLASNAIGGESLAAGNFSTAVGSEAKAQADLTLAAGHNAIASGGQSTAVGYNSLATGSNATALGSTTSAVGLGSTAVGAGAVTSATGAIAISAATSNDAAQRTTASSANAIAMGVNASASQRNALAMGSSASSATEDSVAIGKDVKVLDTGAPQTDQEGSVAIGSRTEVSGKGSVGIGRNVRATARNAVAIGDSALATNTQAVAIARDAQASGAGAVAMGSASRSTSSHTTALGVMANASVSRSVALGSEAVADRAGFANPTTTSVTASSSSTFANKQVYAIDSATQAAKDAVVATVKNSTTNTYGAVSVGNSNVTRQIINVAAGSEDSDAVNVAQLKAVASAVAAAKTEVTGSGLANVTKTTGGNNQDIYNVEVATAAAPTVARGNVTVADADKGKVMTAGDVANAINASEKTSSVVAATGAAVTVAAGAEDTNGNTEYTVDLSQGSKDSLAKADSAVQSIKVKANGADVTTLDQTNNTLDITSGDNITVTDDNGKVKVGLAKDVTGLDSLSSAKVTAGTGANQVVLDNAGVNVGGNTYISGAGLNANDNKITNVANGDVTSTSKDAINGSQLRNTADDIASIIGGNATVDNAGNVTASNIGGTGANTIDDAIKTVKTTVKSTDNTIKVTANTADATNGTVFDISVDAQKLAESAQLPVVYTKADGTKVYKVGNSFFDNKEGTGTAIDATDVVASMQNADGTISPTTLANIKAGTKATDAVNVSQLKGAVDALGGGAAINTDGTIKAPTYNITNPANGTVTAANNVGDALKGLNDAVNSPLTFKGDSGEFNRNLGQTTTVKGGITDTAKLSDNNIGVVAKDGTLDIKLAKDIAVDSVKTGDTTVNTYGVSIANADPNKVVSLTASGLNNGNNRITNVAAGQAGTDAVNKDQLDAAKASATTKVVEGKNVEVTEQTNADGSKTYTVATADDVAFNKVTVGGVVVDGTSNKISGLANGEVSARSTDAINGSQLFATNQNVANNATAIANNAALIAKGINFGGTTGSNNYALGNTINVKGDSNISSETVAGGVQLKLSDVISVGTAKPVKIDGTKGTVGGLTNTTWDANNIVSGQAATEDQLKSAVSAAQAAATTKVTEGKNVTVAEQTNADGSKTYTVATADDLDVTSVKAGSTTINNAGVTVGDKVALTNTGLTAGDVKVSTDGINAGNKAITGVAAGTKDTDAVNVKQLNDQLTATEKTTTAQAGSDKVTVTGTTTGNNTDYVIDLSQATKASLAKADTALQNVVSTDPNLTVSKNGDTVTLDFSDAPVFAGVTAGTGASQVVLDDKGVNVGGNTYISDAGLNANDNKITNVANGAVAKDSKDAVNGSQLYAVQQAATAAKTTVASKNGSVVVTPTTTSTGATQYDLAVKTDGTTITTDPTTGAIKANTTKLTPAANGTMAAPVTADAGKLMTAGDIATAINSAGFTLTAQGKDGSLVKAGSVVDMNNTDGNIVITKPADSNQVTYDLADNVKVAGSIGVTNGPTLSKAGIDAAGTKVTNVAAGSVAANSTDAVNGSQLYALGDQINNRIDDVEKKAHAGIASAMAMENAPYVPGKYTYAAGVAYSGGESAVGLTLRKTADNGRWSLTGGVAVATEGDPSVRLGISGIIK